MKKIIQNKGLQVLVLIFLSIISILFIVWSVITGEFSNRRGMGPISILALNQNHVTAVNNPDVFYIYVCYFVLIATFVIFLTLIAITEYLRKKHTKK